ncbi:phosphoribosyltransferase family protein [Pseudonocardia sp. CA-107938]|uniref:phosphoribosyltransferase family protein n=1 Tax=Pseudonocardia sp. CA-107938 TaxID=3240021 RepID=UPI003D9276DE
MTAAAVPVLDRLGIRLIAHGEPEPETLLGLALRHNPKRAQLLVSRLLGKHVPTDPRLVRAAGLLLGGRVADALAGRPLRDLPHDLLRAALDGDPAAPAALQGHAVAGAEPTDALVLGFAETATGLGHSVAEALAADYLHSTRRPVPWFEPVGGFSEEHSHATEHLLLPAGATLLRGDRPLVLVDDELSTGRTALNTITALHAVAPRERYVLAALVDVRPETSSLVDGVAALGARLDVVALGRAGVHLPADLAARAEQVKASAVAPTGPAGGGSGRPPERVVLADLGWPAGLPVGGRHGFRRADHATLAEALPRLARTVVTLAGFADGDRTLVLGTEELMALPLRLAQTLADAGHDVAFSTTTRSPAVVVDEPGYALRSGITFPAHDDPVDGPGPRFAYNVAGPWDRILVVVDPAGDTPALHTGLLAALAAAVPSARITVVVTP